MSVNEEFPTWIKYLLPELMEVKPGVFKLKGQYSKDNLREFHGWCMKNDSWESRYFKNNEGVFITIEEGLVKVLEKYGLRRMKVTC